MYYVVVPLECGFRVFSFESFRKLAMCPDTNEHSLCFQRMGHLEEFCSMPELEYVCVAAGLEITGSKQVLAARVYSLIEYAVPYFKEARLLAMEQELKTAPPKTIVTKVSVSKKDRIFVLDPTSPYRANSNRERNFEIILNSTTVAEALEQLHKLEKSPGGRYDIQLAVANGRIKLVGPDE